MKIGIIYIFIVAIFLIVGCKKEKGREGDFLKQSDPSNQPIVDSAAEKQRAIEVASARTIGLAHLEEGQLEAAESEFIRLIELAPNETLGYTNLGIVYMRMGKHLEAEIQLEKAIGIDPGDADIRLNLSRVYSLLGKHEQSKQQLEISLKIDSTHVQSLYTLAETYGRSHEANSLQDWENNLKRIVQILPGNIVSRLHLIEALIRNKKSEEAQIQLAEIERVYPEFPMDARDQYQKAINELQNEHYEAGLKASLALHNILKLTIVYQAKIQELRGTRDGNLGVPMITFSQPTQSFLSSNGSVLETIKFTDVTEAADLGMVANLSSSGQVGGYHPHLAVADFDLDGDSDIYLGTPTVNGKYQYYLFSNEFGRFKDVAEKSGFTHSGVEYSASFNDYDNDGYMDLYLVKQGENILYKNVSEGAFKDVTKQAGLAGIANQRKSLFLDLDHEGDLDILVLAEGVNTVFRNNADGTFTDLSEGSVLAGSDVVSRDAVFGDFDDDGDVDLFVVNQDAANALYTNLRNGTYREVTKASGLAMGAGSTAVASGDYNNDGYLDLFLASSIGGRHQLMLNQGDGTFEVDPKSDQLSDLLRDLNGYDTEFFDFDNDGFLDLLVVGQASDSNSSGLRLFHNDKQGGFKDVSEILPEGINGARQLALADYNQDGDLDLFITGIDGGFRLLRNDGGNANHHLKVQLVGIRQGSGKNNYFGIGAKVEVRAGYQYQMRTVTGPNIHFGLGANEDADVIRILWTNGVPQNIFSPGSDQDLLEQQRLKGSCPFLYTWNGSEYVFVKDMMWRSALGMPMGIMGDGASYAFADASEEYIKIPGENLQSENGLLKIQVTSELWETIYMDEIHLMAVDHPESSDIYLDESFVPPPFPDYRIYSVPAPISPVSARDNKGNELTSLILEKDHQYISNFTHTQYQGITELHDLILDLNDGPQTDSLYLFLNGWIFPTDASINAAISQTEKFNSVSPYLQVKNKKGNWVTVIENMGFPAGKDKTMVVDLSGKFLSEDRTVRISTNMEIYWDHIFYSNCPAELPVHTQVMKPISADLHYRGFSTMYRRGMDGPHWFDYNKVMDGPQWRDLTGNYTRFGDVSYLLSNPDNQYVISNAGDEVSITFDATSLPDLSSGWTRDYVIYSVGWVKDGDLNTANGNTVKPLPFHGLSQYPYGANDSYPQDPMLQQYHKEYNTRQVTTESFRNQLKK